MYCECGCGKVTAIADHTDNTYGYVGGKHKRFLRGHRKAVMTADEAFIELVKPRISTQDTDDCWVYTGTTDKRGYGSVMVGGGHPKGKRIKVHRIAWAVFCNLGILPTPDQFVMHRCDNPPCVNPQHLQLGTCAENQKDMAVKGRSHRGEKRSKKLTEADVRSIRAWRAIGMKLKVIAGKFGITEQGVSSITNGYSWKHVT